MTAVAVAPRWIVAVETRSPHGWTRWDSAWAVGWFGLALAARAPLVARIEGVLDHDQSIVGLMALDIAAGAVFRSSSMVSGTWGRWNRTSRGSWLRYSGTRRASWHWPPGSSSDSSWRLSTRLWRCWCDRLTGHLAALVSVLLHRCWCSGGSYRAGDTSSCWPGRFRSWRSIVPGPSRAAPTPSRGSGRWRGASSLRFGYFLNPLSLIVYLTLALDWTFGRHGAELRNERSGAARWIDSRAAPVLWAVLGRAVAPCAGGLLSREDPSRGGQVALHLPPRRGSRPLGNAARRRSGWRACWAGSAWWSGLGGRMVGRLLEHTVFALGALARPGSVRDPRHVRPARPDPFAHSLPIWIRGPWDIGVNLHDGVHAAGDARRLRARRIGIGPDRAGGRTARARLAPRGACARGLAARGRPGRGPDRVGRLARPPCLAASLELAGSRADPADGPGTAGLAVSAILYPLQATSPNASSVRYLVPAWIFLPGLLAAALRRLPRPGRWAMRLLLLVPWTAAQANLWVDLDRPSPLRPLADALDRRGVKAIVAETPIALLVVNLTQGRVGALEYRSRGHGWATDTPAGSPRAEPVTCVNDLTLSWFSGRGSTEGSY